MNTLTANTALEEALRELKGLTEVRDGQDTVMGYFLPAMTREELLLYLKVLAEYDPAEIARRKAEPGKRYTLQEILAQLEAMGKPSCATP